MERINRREEEGKREVGRVKEGEGKEGMSEAG